MRSRPGRGVDGVRARRSRRDGRARPGRRRARAPGEQRERAGARRPATPSRRARTRCARSVLPRRMAPDHDGRDGAPSACKRAPTRARASAARVRRVAGPVLEERAHGALQVLGGEQVAGELRARARRRPARRPRPARGRSPSSPRGRGSGPPRARARTPRAAASKPSSGRTRLTTFQRSSVAASKSSPVMTSSRARAGPARSASRCVPPIAGVRPTTVSTRPKRADSAASSRSQAERRARRRPSGTARGRRTRSAAAAPRRCGSTSSSSRHSRRGVLDGEAVEEVHVDPAADRAALGADEQAARRVGRDVVDRRPQRGEHRRVEEVQRRAWPA